MHAHTFFSSLSVKVIHILVVLSMALTSAFSAAGVQRAAANTEPAPTDDQRAAATSTAGIGITPTQSPTFIPR
jgi:hypothetical protein